MTTTKLLLIFTSLLWSGVLHAQNKDSLIHLSENFLAHTKAKSDLFEKRIQHKSDAIIARMLKQEEKVYRKLQKKDSTKAKQLLANSKAEYQKLKEKIANPMKGKRGEYISKIDTLKTTLNFLGKQQQLTASGNFFLPEDISKTITAVNNLDDKLKQAEQIKSFIKQRRKFLGGKLGSLGMMKEIKKLSKQGYYYGAQIEEYKKQITKPDKIEQRALQALNQLPVFRKFMRENSQLASMFRLPGTGEQDPVNAVSLQGLQTRAMIDQQIQQQVGADGRQALQQNVQQAQSQLSQLKDKVNALGGGSSTSLEQPDFKPNSQRANRFLNRLEYGVNIQSQPSTRFLPTSSELGLSIGYKLNDKSIVGVGASYRWGWGRDIQHIKISHEGFGLRSFIDTKLKGSFYLSGGYEINYYAALGRMDELKDLKSWKQSGLIGVSKKYKLVKKGGNMQILWIFLSKRQEPGTQAIVFRIGAGL